MIIYVRLFVSPWTVALRFLCPWYFSGKNTGVGCYSLLQGIFLTQGSNLGLLHCRQILYHLSHCCCCCQVTSVVSDSVRPNRQQPECMKVKSESEVAQSCITLSNPMDCSLPGSSVHGIFQARILEWGAIAFSVR